MQSYTQNLSTQLARSSGSQELTVYSVHMYVFYV